MDFGYPEYYPPMPPVPPMPLPRPMPMPIPYTPAPPEGMQGVVLARAYIPFQQYTVSYPPMEALAKGTMFPELYRPYHKHE